MAARRHRYVGLLVAHFVLCVGCERPTSAPPVVETQPGPPLTVRITGHEFKWHIHYPGADGEFETPDDLRTQQHLHVPATTQVTIELLSRDYVYSLYLPHVDLLQMTFPGQSFPLEFDSEAPGAFELLGTQMCGYTHPNLIGKLVVYSQQEFDAWCRSQVSKRP